MVSSSHPYKQRPVQSQALAQCKSRYQHIRTWLPWHTLAAMVTVATAPVTMVARGRCKTIPIGINIPVIVNEGLFGFSGWHSSTGKKQVSNCSRAEVCQSRQPPPPPPEPPPPPPPFLYTLIFTPRKQILFRRFVKYECHSNLAFHIHHICMVQTQSKCKLYIYVSCSEMLHLACLGQVF